MKEKKLPRHKKMAQLSQLKIPIQDLHEREQTAATQENGATLATENTNSGSARKRKNRRDTRKWRNSRN